MCFFNIHLIDLSQVSQTQQVIQEMTIKQLLVSTANVCGYIDVTSSFFVGVSVTEREGRNVDGNLWK
jgi:hypothetical protein